MQVVYAVKIKKVGEIEVLDSNRRIMHNWSINVQYTEIPWWKGLFYPVINDDQLLLDALDGYERTGLTFIELRSPRRYKAIKQAEQGEA